MAAPAARHWYRVTLLTRSGAGPFAPGSRIGIGFLSAEGTPICTTESRDVEVTPPGEAGLYSARVCIPGGFFLPGELHLAVCLWNDREILDIQEPAQTFSVDAGPSILYQSKSERKGYVHTVCDWEITRLAADVEAAAEEAHAGA
jgi:hypothetical protein